MSSEEREGEQQISPLDSDIYVRTDGPPDRPQRATGLGELNTDLLIERGEGYGPRAENPLTGHSLHSYAPPDMLIQSGLLEASRNAPLGTPPINVDVISTYKARKVNAVDFIKTLEGTQSFLTSNNSIITKIGFTVPDNKVCVINGFKYYLEPYNTDIDVDEINTTIVVNSIPDAFYVDMHLGQQMNDYQECYILGPPESEISLNISTTYISPIDVASYTAQVHVHFYGQMLENKGLPTNFEPGNLRHGFK